MNDAFHVHPLGGYQRKTLLQVKTHLVAEIADGAGAGAVGFFRTMIENMPE